MPAPPFLNRKGAEIGDVDEAILFAFTDVDKRRIDAGENILDSAEIDITDLVATLGHHQLIDTFVIEDCGDPQLLSDDDLLGHGGGNPRQPCGKVLASRLLCKG